MSNKKLLVYLSTVLAVLIPCPGRFAFGIVLTISFSIIFMISSVLNVLLNKLDITDYSKFLFPPLVCALVIIAYQALVIISPVIALQLSFVFYIQAFSIYLLVFMFEEYDGIAIKDIFYKQFFKCLWYSAITLSFTLLRDILGYGTISFPSFDGIYAVHLFKSGSLTFMNFFASIPGAAVISAVAISVFLYLNKQKKDTIEEGIDE